MTHKTETYNVLVVEDTKGNRWEIDRRFSNEGACHDFVDRYHIKIDRFWILARTQVDTILHDSARKGKSEG